MIGFFVYHPTLKIGKVARADDSLCAIHFFQERTEKLFERRALQNGELTRCNLPLGTDCDANGMSCRIERIKEDSKDHRPILYEVTTQDGLQLTISEVDLVPRDIVREDPVTSLASLQQEGYPLFAARSELVAAHADVVRQGGGLTALLSSRIDVRPHQAYVAGVVLQDRLRRYILADEVGLGKTIEAGVAIQERLSTQPDARVLILCPGSLTQQWLCELYTKFSSRVFTLLDLYRSPSDLSDRHRRTVIAPLQAMNGPHRNWLQHTAWDLVVVDEVHHLLASEDAYTFVKCLSGQAPSVLLLSALPAQQRKTEFLRLLAILEPHRYAETVPEDFDRLYDAQPEIGRQLRRLRRRLEEAIPDAAEIIEIVDRVISNPALAGDELLRGNASGVRAAGADVVCTGQAFLKLAAERSRINRRILRNRRSRLVEDGLIDATIRSYLPNPYEAGQPEIDALQAAMRLIRDLSERIDPGIWSAFARVLMQSCTHPRTATELLECLAAPAVTAHLAPPEALGHLAGTLSWTEYRDGLLAVVRPLLDRNAVHAALDAARLWGEAETGMARTDELVELVERLERKHKKIVVFAGYPGLAELVLAAVQNVFDPESACGFRTDMDRAEKEANICRFRTDPETWLLVCDESGGEGRNFQFAGAVVHYDTPWYVSRVEQRIGRLDRLGRPTPDVLTSALFARGTPEEDLIRCFADGFRVYRESVSGLEFALRDLELDVVRSLLGAEEQPFDAYLAELAKRVAQERVQEENESVLDEASFNREAADKYRRSNTLAEAEERLESAFTEFVRKVANIGAARALPDEEFPTGIWAIDPSQFRHISFAGADRGSPPGVHLGASRGTFRRRIAQERLDLQFFSVGHPLFDGVMQAVREQQCGRVYALDVNASGHPAWQGFEFVFVVGPDRAILNGNNGLLEQAGRVFVAAPIHLFINRAGAIAPAGEDLLRIRRGLKEDDKDRSWWNLTKQKGKRVTLPFGGQDAWRAAVQQAAATAHTEARRSFAERLGPHIATSLATLEEQARQAAADPAERHGLELLVQAIKGWSVTVDAVGFLSINGGLGRPT